MNEHTCDDCLEDVDYCSCNDCVHCGESEDACDCELCPACGEPTEEEGEECSFCVEAEASPPPHPPAFTGLP